MVTFRIEVMRIGGQDVDDFVTEVEGTIREGFAFLEDGDILLRWMTR
jgi:hypothetical protein